MCIVSHIVLLGCVYFILYLFFFGNPYLWAKLHWITCEHVARLAYCIIDELDIAIQQIAAHMLDEATQIADGDGLNLQYRYKCASMVEK